MITDRGMFIKQFVERKKSAKYLEIGLSTNPRAPYRLISDIEQKHSIDMDLKTGADFVMDSDSFFRKLDNNELNGLDKEYKWDFIFIDGWHFAEQVYIDLCNSLNHLSEDGVIFMHDSLPWSYDMTIETSVSDRIATCQDAWKVIEYCLKEREDLDICTLEENYGGLAVVRKSNTFRPLLSREYNRFYQYGVYERERFKFMNTIKEENLLEWLEKPTYRYLEE